jgi:hypothetical protein
MQAPVDARSVPGEKLAQQLTFGTLLRDIAAAAVSAIDLLTSIVSFASLMFSGALAAGSPTAVWAMLVGSGVAGVWIALRSSLPLCLPASTEPLAPSSCCWSPRLPRR